MAKRHTTVNLDPELLEDAMEVLGTKQVTETIHGAFKEVIRQHRIRRFLARDLPDLTPEALERMRAWRTFSDEPPKHARSA
jgi:Arc/MetJ family transcription regulator